MTSLYRIDYTKENQNWNTYIVARTSDDAVAFLKKVVQGPIAITTISQNSRVDAITNEVFAASKNQLTRYGFLKQEATNEEPVTQKEESLGSKRPAKRK